jgi:hypothetical protein
MALAAGIGLAAPSAAFAAYDDPSCWGVITCQTRSIEAHGSQHWVRYRGNSGNFIYVKDMDTGAVVASVFPTDGNWHTIPGLYGRHYKLFASDPTGGNVGAHGTISNCTSGCVNH